MEPTYDPPAPFPNRLRPKNNTTQMEKILDIFRQVKVNVPLVEAFEQVPSYAKFLKDLCTKKRAHQTPKVFLVANISEIGASEIQGPWMSDSVMHYWNHSDRQGVTRLEGECKLTPVFNPQAVRSG